MIMRKTVHTLILVGLMCAGPRIAAAHAFLDHASPRVGNTVSAPREVMLWFTQKLEPAFSSIEVQNEQGASVTAGKATVIGDRNQMRVSLKPLSPGTYKVIWRVLSVDTHRTEGNFNFRVGP
ncbi:MAG TPA: copper resistance protein CopC [Pseudolabrys sp.]|nr:copper resistance protein CopC [Pseudolabrys sp.]